jgi:uncharacterized protein YciI
MWLSVVPLLLAQASPSPSVEADPALQMMTYQMVFLRHASAKEPDGPEARKRQGEHLALLAKLNRERVNVIYGPFTDDADPRGLCVMDVPDAAAAKARLADDPFVKAGSVTLEVKPWMGPRGWFAVPPTTDVTQPGALEPLVFGVLVRGPNRSQGKQEAAELQRGHLAYMDSLHKQGKLVMAGPFLDDSDWRGVVVYRVATVEDARALAAGDPAVKAGRLAIEVRPWMTLRGILK